MASISGSINNSADDNALVSDMDDTDDETDDTPDPDTHDKKQTVVKGLLSMSLITSNVSQLRTLIYADRNKNYPLWVSLIILIVISLMLQIIEGGMLFHIYNVPLFAKGEPPDPAMSSDREYVVHYKEKEKMRKIRVQKALVLSNTVAIIVMIITVLNMIISAIGWQ